MTKKALVLAAVAVFAAALSASAGDSMKGKAGEKTAAGTIASVDVAAKTQTLTDAKGGSQTIQWNDGTKIMGGELKEGAAVQVGYSESENKMWATWIRVQEGTK